MRLYAFCAYVYCVLQAPAVNCHSHALKLNFATTTAAEAIVRCLCRSVQVVNLCRRRWHAAQLMQPSSCLLIS